MTSQKLLSRLIDAGTVLLAVGAIAFAGISLAGRSPEQAGPTPASLGVSVPGWSELTRNATGVHSGSRDTLLVFTDFQCPFCRQLSEELEKLEPSERPTVLIHHLPLPSLHQDAIVLAEVVECAGRFGGAGEMHDALFAQQGEVVVADGVVRLSRPVAAGVEPCLTLSNVTEADEERVAQHMSRARELGLTTTPTAALNGRWVDGSVVIGLRDLLDGA